MKKEELLEMVDATINENGKRNITGKALNLALTEIINSMGEAGGGMDTIYFIPYQPTEELSAPEEYEPVFTEEEIAAMVASNVEVYNKLSEAFKNGKKTSSYNVDFTYYLTDVLDRAGEVMGVSAPTLNVMQIVLSESSPSSLESSFNPMEFYEIGDVVMMFGVDATFMEGTIFSGGVVFLPNGYVYPMSNVG